MSPYLRIVICISCIILSVDIIKTAINIFRGKIERDNLPHWKYTAIPLGIGIILIASFFLYDAIRDLMN